MDWNSVAGDWKRFRSEVRMRWPLLTEAQLDSIAGQRGPLAEQVCVSYGTTAGEAERQIGNFEARDQFFRTVSSR